MNNEITVRRQFAIMRKQIKTFHLRLRNQHPIKRIIVMSWQSIGALRMIKSYAKFIDTRLMAEPNHLFRCDWYRLWLDGMFNRRFPDRHSTNAKLVIWILQNLSRTRREARTSNHRPNDNLRVEKESHGIAPSNISET